MFDVACWRWCEKKFFFCEASGRALKFLCSRYIVYGTGR